MFRIMFKTFSLIILLNKLIIEIKSSTVIRVKVYLKINNYKNFQEALIKERKVIGFINKESSKRYFES